MNSVKVYTSQFCGFCSAAKNLLSDRNIPFEEILISTAEEKSALYEKTGHMSLPQIFIDGELIGGFQELRALAQDGALEARLAS